MFFNKWIVFHHPTNRFRWNRHRHRHHCCCRYRCHTRNFTLCQNVEASPTEYWVRERKRQMPFWWGWIWRCWTRYNDANICFTNDNLMPHLAHSLYLFVCLCVCVCTFAQYQRFSELCVQFQTNSHTLTVKLIEREWSETYQLNWCRAWWMARITISLGCQHKQWWRAENPVSVCVCVCVYIMRWFLFEI